VLQATYTFLVANGVAPPVTHLLDPDQEPWVRKELEQGESREHDNARSAVHSLLRPQDILTVMIGAMGHDVGHPGLSNVFMVRPSHWFDCRANLNNRLSPEKCQNAALANIL
jgi:hypothetical protein